MVPREPHQRVAVQTNCATDTLRKACLEAGTDAFFNKSTELAVVCVLPRRGLRHSLRLTFSTGLEK
jgi:hypothetical protein